MWHFLRFLDVLRPLSASTFNAECRAFVTFLLPIIFVLEE